MIQLSVRVKTAEEAEALQEALDDLLEELFQDGDLAEVYCSQTESVCDGGS